MSKLILAKMQYKEKQVLAAAIQEEKRIAQIHLLNLEKPGILGNIYIGKVMNVAKNLHAAFVDIGNGMICYYDLKEKTLPLFAQPKKDSIIKIGDELAVQVKKEGMKSKLPSVSGALDFPGRYLVLTTKQEEKGRIAFSKKLSKEEKKRLSAALEGALPQDAGVIVRTNAREAAEEKIKRELEELKGRLNQVRKKALSRTCYSLLEESLPDYLKEVQDVYARDLDEIVTDEKSLYQHIAGYLDCFREKRTAVRLYEDRLLPLYKLYALETVLEEAQKERVWLKSGGFLVIQQTEAFVSIDVNTGKFVKKRDVEETFFQMNEEAAKELALQLRLRNLSGIILIDFINMRGKDAQRRLLELLRKELRKDPVKCEAVDITALGIAEVTRKKVKKPLEEEIRELFQS